MSEMFTELSMIISKVSLDKKSQEMRWSMVASDTGLDSYGDKTSVELFKNFVKHIENKDIPEEFKSVICEEGWCGGIPYVSISHLRSAGGANVPGDVSKVFVDGKKLKAKGTLRNNLLGFSVFKSLLKDLYGENKEYDDKIRVSIGFLDLKHSHGDYVFERKSIDDVCEKCAAGVGDKVFLDGILVHLALTRKPANPRTDMEVEKMSDIKTRDDDIKSIVGEDVAESLVKKTNLDSVLVEREEDSTDTNEQVIEEKSEDIEGQIRSAREKFYNVLYALYPNSYPWIMRVLDDAVIAELDNVIYKIPYTKADDGIVFSEKSEWKEVDFQTKSVLPVLEEKTQELLSLANSLHGKVSGDVAMAKLSAALGEISSVISNEFTSPEDKIEMTIKSAVQEEVKAIIPTLVAEMSKVFADNPAMASAKPSTSSVPTPRSFAAKSVVGEEEQALSQIQRLAIKSVR